MEKALSRFHTCTELLKVFAETVKNQAISCVTHTLTECHPTPGGLHMWVMVCEFVEAGC